MYGKFNRKKLNFFNFSLKIIKTFEDISELLSKFNKFPVANFSRGGDKVFLEYHVIT